MANQYQDSISITTTNGKAFDRWTSFEILNSIMRSAESSFEIGDDGSWEDFSELAALGTDVAVLLNGKPRMKGKVEMLNSPLNISQSSVFRFVVRTIMADLEVQTADPRIRFDSGNNASVTIADLVNKTLKLAGVDLSRVIFTNNPTRNLMTGARAKGAKPDPSLEPLTIQQAAVQPGETVKCFLERHLRRHGLMIFDGPSGEIIISAPDDQQDSLYRFVCFRGAGADNRNNNLKEIERNQDATGAASSIVVLGVGGGKDAMRQKLAGFQINPVITAAGFNRAVYVVDEGVKTKELAARTAARLMSETLRRQDAITLAVDGLSYQDGKNRIAYANDTTCDLVLDTLGGAVGKFYVESVALRVSASEGSLAQLSVVNQGTWAL
jgi:prophage tail gpP-like protein